MFLGTETGLTKDSNINKIHVFVPGMGFKPAMSELETLQTIRAVDCVDTQFLSETPRSEDVNQDW